MVFPYHKQESAYTCGAACMRMVFEKLGIKKSEKQMKRLLGTNKIKGTAEKEFPRIAEKYKINYIVERRGKLSDLKKLHKEGWLIIVCYHNIKENVDHYSVLRKIDNTYIHLYDPWSFPDHKFKISYFKKIWKTKAEKDLRWFIALKR
ncbi:C39 family peptidase [Candidatus Pacearchaeota archaeon]|nr:C39 family peptidase [Candidatus Pacearchaeota archaeon]